MNSLTLTKPDDWHLHLRDGEVIRDVLPATTRVFSRAVVMPNLKPPVTTTQAALDYRARILAARPEGSTFQPLMTLYLTDNTTADDVRLAASTPEIVGIKLYPAGATTHSDAGVTHLAKVQPALEAMVQHDLPLLVHAESTHPDVDVFDREAVFLEQQLVPTLQNLPTLKVVVEHITTADAVQFVLDAPINIAATITAHHLLLNRNAMFAGGLRPHRYCLPVLKRERHREALIEAATSGNPKFFLGTDSAPHPRHHKEAHCGCAGMYTAPAALELYAEVFDDAGALDRLEGFSSHHGPDFYQLPRNSEQVTLVREEWFLPESLPLASDTIVPFPEGRALRWRCLG